MLGLIRAVFRSHRPPPPCISYTVVRKELTDRGAFDYAESYSGELLGAQFRSRRTQTPCIPLRRPSPPQFERPAFNEERDPGPPTADIFEPAPKKPTLFSDLPTPEPAGEGLKTIGTIKVSSEYGYYVYSLVVEGNLVP